MKLRGDVKLITKSKIKILKRKQFFVFLKNEKIAIKGKKIL